MIKVKQIIWAGDHLICLTEDGRLWFKYPDQVDWQEMQGPSNES